MGIESRERGRGRGMISGRLMLYVVEGVRESVEQRGPTGSGGDMM